MSRPLPALIMMGIARQQAGTVAGEGLALDGALIFLAGMGVGGAMVWLLERLARRQNNRAKKWFELD